MKNLVFAILTLTGLCACSVSQSPVAYPPYSQLAQEREPITQSLFESADRTISEADIQRLLDGKIKLPDSARIAIFNFGTNNLNKYYSGYAYDEEYLRFRQNNIDTLIAALQRSPRVAKTLLMPTMMTHANPNLTNLRESAVRLQADMLVIFTTTSDIYYKYKAFKKDQAKAFATIETVLLDIRTSLVPYSDIVTKEELIIKEVTDLDIRETQKRAENAAIMSALTESGNNILAFLNE